VVSATQCCSSDPWNAYSIPLTWPALLIPPLVPSTLEDIVTKYRKDRRDLLLYLLSSNSVAPTVVLPTGATSLRDVDLDHVSVPYAIQWRRRRSDPPPAHLQPEAE